MRTNAAVSMPRESHPMQRGWATDEWHVAAHCVGGETQARGNLLNSLIAPAFLDEVEHCLPPVAPAFLARLSTVFLLCLSVFALGWFS